MSLIQFGDKSLDLSRPHVMGILNVTPDSFSDGGRHRGFNAALQHVERMVNEGAAFIDVGGESTRPGANPVTLQEELDRVLPIVEAVKSRFDTIISVDTSSPEVMLEAAKLGAGFINDVRALEREGAIDAAAKTGLPVCLMHMKGTPENMQVAPEYGELVGEVASYLTERAALCMSAGIDKAQIILDPGIGFGKTLTHNLTLLNRTEQLLALGYPVLIGVSRKTMIGQVLDAEVDERLFGTMGANAATYQKGARIFRVHDVKPHVQMLELMYRIERES